MLVLPGYNFLSEESFNHISIISILYAQVVSMRLITKSITKRCKFKVKTYLGSFSLAVLVINYTIVILFGNIWQILLKLKTVMVET